MSPVTQRSPAVPYDFRRPRGMGRAHLRLLAPTSDALGDGLRRALAEAVRGVVAVAAEPPAALHYQEYLKGIAEPACLTVLSLAPQGAPAVLHLPLDLVFVVLERLLGGQGTGRAPRRPLTAVEWSLVQALVEGLLPDLAGALAPVVATQPAIARQVSSPDQAEAAAPSDPVVVFGFSVGVGTGGGVVSLCLPAQFLLPALESLTPRPAPAAADPGPLAPRGALATRVEDAPLTVAVRFPPIALSLGEIADLRRGDVLPLHHPIGSTLEVSVAGVPRFAARPGRRGSRLACVISPPDSKEAP